MKDGIKLPQPVSSFRKIRIVQMGVFFKIPHQEQETKHQVRFKRNAEKKHGSMRIGCSRLRLRISESAERFVQRIGCINHEKFNPQFYRTI